MEEFLHIRKKGSIEEYRTPFKDMKVMVMREKPWFDEESYMECFLGGLREELKNLVMSSQPKNGQEAYEVAARQELVYEMLRRPQNPQKYPSHNPNYSTNLSQEKNQNNLNPTKAATPLSKPAMHNPSFPQNPCYYCKEAAAWSCVPI